MSSTGEGSEASWDWLLGGSGNQIAPLGSGVGGGRGSVVAVSQKLENWKRDSQHHWGHWFGGQQPSHAYKGGTSHPAYLLSARPCLHT